MRGFFSKIVLPAIFITGLASLVSVNVGCGRGGAPEDDPFVFGGVGNGNGSFNVPPPPPPLCDGVTCPEGQVCDIADGLCKSPHPPTGTEKCQGITCPTGQSCDPADGQCKAPTGPACTQNSDCHTAGQICQDGHCVTPPACTHDADCTHGQVCDNTTKQCKVANLCAAVDCATGQSCNPQTGTCQCVPQDCTDNQIFDTASCSCKTPPAGTCVVNFQATLTLSGDAPDDQFDIPSACFYYYLDPNNPYPSRPYNQGNCSPGPGNNCHNDLFCCGDPDRPLPASGLDSQNRPISCEPPSAIVDPDAHGRVLNTIHYPAHPSSVVSPIKISFNVDESGPGCRWSIQASDFPEFRLENSALLASLIIDAGARHEPALFDANPEIARLVNEGTCNPITLPDGTPGIELVPNSDSNNGLRFRIQFYQNSLTNSGIQPFQSPLGSAPQLVPPPRLDGVDQPPLQFTTRTATADPIVPPALVTDPSLPMNDIASMSITGIPLHATDDNQSVLKMVTAVTITDKPSTIEGSGVLGSQLGGAPLTAELNGPVKRVLDNGPIRSIDDLRPQNCGGIHHGCTQDSECGTNERCQNSQCVPITHEPDQLILSMESNFGETTTLTIDGDATHPENGFSVSHACATGMIAGESCVVPLTETLPYAKEAVDHTTPPAPAIAGRFVQSGTLTIRSDALSNIDLPLTLSDHYKAFRITNFASLQGHILTPGTPAVLQVEFDPDTDPSLCSTDPTGLVNCEADLVLTQAPAPSLRVHITGQAQIAAPKIIYQAVVDLSNPDGTGQPISDSLNFDGETLVGGNPSTKLIKITNVGVRPFSITGIAANNDAGLNFRLGSVYRGTSFNQRTWISNQRMPWVVCPTDDCNHYFYLNYGPLGKIVPTNTHCPPEDTSGDRCDGGHLTITANVQSMTETTSVTLSGKAKEDHRAVLSVYVKDATRALSLVDGGRGETAELTGADGEPLFEIKGLAFSLRQDGSERTVYIKNTAPTGPRIDSLQVRQIDFVGDPTLFHFRLSDELMAAYGPSGTCVSSTDLHTCINLANTDNPKKVGTIQFVPPASGSYTTYRAELHITADTVPSVGCGDRNCDAPITGGRYTPDGQVDRNQSETHQKNYALSGASGAPQGPFDLRIHRMLAALSAPLVTTQRSQIVATATRGTVTRAINEGLLSTTSPDDFIDVFTIKGAGAGGARPANGMINLDPISGIAKFHGLFTPFDATTRSENLDGLRIYNAPGTDNPSHKEYYFQCASVGGRCNFFYLYVGDWGTTSAPASCGGGKFAIAANPADASSRNWLDPTVPAEATCMATPGVLHDAVNGFYDPVTGEITFPNLAIRLFSPVTLNLGAVDSTLQTSLTTECVTAGRVPDTAAQANRLITSIRSPHNLLTLRDFDTTLMIPPGVSWADANPLQPYVTGENCADGEMHGRRFPLTDKTVTPPLTRNLDDTGTLDDNGSTGYGTFNLNFDLAGVASIKSGLGNVNGKMMYIIIKAEVGHQCTNGAWVQNGSMCSPPE